ncbi:MAG: mucoidy inhibitor MuiA family protein [Chitinophagaceae bacterium]|nr:mucoidy inhibitor MuiA family protein [Chitinophagaceae bacterium]
MRFICVLLLAVMLNSSVRAADDKLVTAVLKEATVYRAGAELVHVARLTLPQGTTEVIIDGISNRVDLNSIQINTGGKVTVMSVEFSTDYLKPVIKSMIVRKLEDSIESVQTELAKVQVQLRTGRELLDLLKSNRQIGGTQTGLSVAELIKMIDYYKLKSLELETEMAAQKMKELKLNKLIQKIQQQINEEEQKNTSTTGKLLLKLLTPMPGTYNFNISYLTPLAFWNAAYDLNIENIQKPVALSYKAKVVQTTGIDWKDVKLTLATSMPAQQGTAPVFQAWFLEYADPIAKMESRLTNSIQGTLQSKVAGLEMMSQDKRLSEAVVVGYLSTTNTQKPLYVVNGEPVSDEEYQNIDPGLIKSIEVLKENASSLYGARAANGAILITLKDGINDHTTMNDNDLNVSFTIDIPYDVPSNGKEQQVTLKEFTVPAFYKYYAAPKLDKDAYLLAGVADWESLNLLPGEANIMVEGTYIGKTFIDPNSTLDTLTLTLGRDKRVVVKREKLKDFSSVKFLGNFKKQVIAYEITVKNNKKEKTDMILKDQFPISSNKEVEVELVESSNGSVNAELGVVTWKLNLEPGESKKIRVSYSVRYPKDKVLNL